MIIDIHAHVTTDPVAQIARARAAGVDRTVMLSTRVHPEAARTVTEVRAAFTALTEVVSGQRVAAQAAEAADTEFQRALAITDGTLGMQNVRLPASREQLASTLATATASPTIIGIGELTPAADSASAIEPVVQMSAEVSVAQPLPVLAHGFAPNTAADLRTYAELAGRHPDVPIIVGAFGGLNSMALIELATERPNLYIDTSSALQMFVLAAAIREVPEQCLFGSNTPYGDVAAALATTEAACPDPVSRDLVLGDNAVRLFGLP